MSWTELKSHEIEITELQFRSFKHGHTTKEFH